MKRVLSFLLALVMVLGCLPGLVFAEESGVAAQAVETITVIACSDYQDTGNTEADVNETARQSRVDAIFTEMAAHGISPYGVLFCGDYTRYGLSSNTTNNKQDVKDGISELRSFVNNKVGGAQKMVFVQGNHDRDATTSQGLSAGGKNDTEHYGVWVLNNNDYGWTSAASDYCKGDPAKIQAEAAEMKAYFEAKIAENYTKPIFVAAHIPLHYSYRTRAHQDGIYAKYIFDVINEAGAAGLNIIYLFGHNHSASSDSYIGGGSAFLTRGESIFISQLGDSAALPHEETLNFTYMNCGYLGYVRNENAGGNELSMSVFEITGDEVLIKRISANGMVPVRAAGALYSGASETAATYGLTTSEMKTYMSTSFSTATVTPASEVSQGSWVEIPHLTTAYYQTNKFGEGQAYVIANWGDEAGNGLVLRNTTSSTVTGNTEVLVRQNDRGCYFTLDSGIASQCEWLWQERLANTIDGTLGVLKNVSTGRYLEMYDGTSGGLLSGDKKEFRTTSADTGSNTDHNKLWVYDNTVRTSASGAPASLVGKPYGLLSHSVKDANLSANRYYLMYYHTGAYWAARGYGSVSTSTGCAPTYIYAKVTDHYDPANSTYAMATVEDHIDFYLGQFADREEMKDFIRSNLLEVSVKDVDGNVSGISDYMLSTTADPNAEGVYTATVSYKGRVLATFEIHIYKATVTNMEISPAEGVVFQNAKSTEKTGSVLTITYDNGVVVEVPITVSMLKTSGNNAVSTKNIGTQTNLKVVYGDITVDGYSLRVIDRNYPEYPNPGSVKVDKEGTGVEFDKTGAANVELSATGVPLVDGLDVIVMVDTSSSMSAGYTEDGVRRDKATYNAINQLITTLQGDVENGILGETKIAVADFNAYKKASAWADYGNQPWGYYALDGNCWVRDPEHNPNNSGLHYSSSTNSSHTHGARTGVTDPLNLTEAAFVNVMDLSPTWASSQTLPLQSGTNYDFAFDAIYQLGYNIQEYNRKNGRDGRELVVIFLSDGCPFQYNYWMSHANNYNWNDWLSGTLDNAGLNELTGNVGTFKHFYNSNEGRHWMAEAIKGSPDEYYKVIRKSDTGLEGVIKNLNTTDATNKQYMGELPGLGAQMYSIALGITDGDANITYETIIGVLERIASKPENFYNVNSGEELVNVFSSIAGTVTQAATQSYFLDTMGEDYDLYMSNQIICSNGNVLEGVVPAIQVRDYAVNNYVTSETPEAILEEITFKENYLNVPEGTDMVVYQKLLNEDGTYTENTINMKMGELLVGKYVYYNTSKTDSKTVTYNGKTITVEPETFFYITTTLVEGIEYALNYYVYLEDALDDNDDNDAVAAGTYPTNESAKLYYENYLGNSCTKDTVSPELDWGEAKVNYRFYLVNDAGEPIKQNGTVISYTVDTFVTKVTALGDTGSDTFDLNTQSPVIQSGKLTIPEGYALYEYNGGAGISYTVKPVSGGGIGGWWKITGDDSATQTTYVQNYKPDKPDRISEELVYENTSNASYDFSNTTVWIALVKLPEPDMPVGKTVEATSDSNKFTLTLDAYATGDELDGVLLDKNLVMKEVLSDYVQLDADAPVEYLVYTQDYLGNGQWGDLVSFNGTVETTTKNGRVETVEVSGFDYGANFVMETPHVDPNDSSNTAFRGRRLVLKVYIETREGFWGGNNVPTNKSTTAIYSDGEVFKPFPVPEINVPIDVTVDVVDKTIYYDGSLDSDGDGKEGEELIHQVTIGGMEVEVKEDGTFTPAEDWMDDFAQASWDENSTTPGSDLSNTEPQDYTYTVVVTPNSGGTTNQSPNPGNIAGNVDGGTVDPEDLTAPSQSAEDTGHVFVLVPEIIFQDSTTDYGTPTEGYDYAGKDYVDTSWVFMEDDEDTTTAPEVTGKAPDLDLSYTPSTEDAPNGSFVTDTQVEVTVTMNGSDITDIVNFGWHDDCTYGDHTGDMDIPDHKGSDENTNEFWVHVTIMILPDTVVVDFGHSIDINVLVNDKFGSGAQLVALGVVPEDLTATSSLQNGFVKTYSSAYGSAKISGDKVVYTPANMQMSGKDVFAYAVKYMYGDVERYYYDTITVVPATVIYYEDSFVTFSKGDWNPTGGGHTGNQGQDRPGQFEYPNYDTNNIYGFDPVYNASKTHSFGSSQYVRVDSTTYKNKGKWPTATFTFTGTGFDLISLTSNTTGFITCKVYEGTQATGDAKYSWVVDTYYGYTRVLNETHPWIKETWTYTGERWAVTTEAVTERGTDSSIPTNPMQDEQVILYKENYQWKEATGTANPLYQIPVIKSPELEHKTYTVVITPTYVPFFNHTGTNGYDFYLDAVRIYGPAENMESYYLQDGEAWPQFIELRQQLLSVDASGNATSYVNGVSFIDSVATGGTVSDYSAYGPNNEVYLNEGQSIAFAIDSMGQSIANVHVGIKTFNGAGELAVKTVNTSYTAKIATASHTDLYYSITDAYIPVDGSNISNVIVLTNNGSEPITLTTLKITYDSETAIAKENQAKLVMNTALMQAAENEVKLSLKPSPSAERKLMITMGHSVSFESDLRLNYRVKLSELEGYDLDSAYLTVEKDVYLAKGEQDVETYVLYPELTSDRMIFNLEGILSVEMGSELRATLHIQDLQSRSYTSAVDQYSILAYAKEAFSRCSYEEQPELYRLLIDTLNYGAAAQTYFDRRTDSLVNAGLDAYQQYATKELTAELTASKVVLENTNSGLVSKLGFSVSFADRTELNAKLTLAEAAEITAVKVTDAEGNTVATLTEFTKLSDGKLQVTYSGIKATQMRQMFYFTAYAGEEVAGATYGYSVEAYAREAIAAGLPGLTDLARACMYYGDSAENYFTQRGGESK